VTAEILEAAPISAAAAADEPRTVAKTITGRRRIEEPYG
jgi:hypothetical protein